MAGHNDELRRKVRDIASEGPAGDSIRYVGNGKGVDEYGRIFYVESFEDKERKKKYAYQKSDQRHFTFAAMAEITEITEGLSNKHCGYLLMLQPYVQFKTNLIATKERESVPMDKKKIAEVLDVQPRTVKGILDKLTEFGALEITEEGYYRVNDRYHFRGKVRGDVDKLVKTFHSTLKKLKLKPADLGAVYKLLPHVHYETNFVCKNPFEGNPSKVEFCNKTELAELFGITRSKASDVIKRLTSAGVIIEVKRKAAFVDKAAGDGRETVVAINPHIISRIQGEHQDKTLLQLFNTAEY
jgi:Mn-dependent DtxR family transcriptional regulator